MDPKAISIWEPERVEAFYRSIWPVDTGHPLIRIGGGTDGGYLVPDALNGIELCVSPGICNYIEFERSLGETYGIPSIACDPSPTKLREVPGFIRIDQLALRGHSRTGEVTLSDWLTKSGHKDTWPLLLSMDIEGAELEVLQTASDRDINKI